MPKGTGGRHCIMHRSTKHGYRLGADHVEVFEVCVSDQVGKQE